MLSNVPNGDTPSADIVVDYGTRWPRVGCFSGIRRRACRLLWGAHAMPERLPESISSFGAAIDDHIRLIYWITGIAFVIAQFVLFYALVRFRKRRGERAAWLPADTWRTNAWVLVPALVVLVFDLWIEADSAKVWAHVKEDIPDKPDLLVRITAQQFSWSFEYAGPDQKLGTADDIVTSELKVPLGKVVRFQLESADVLHSFYVPQLRLKQDAVPGRSIPGWFSATTEGSYEIACAELCGPVHGYMKNTLQVVSPAAFDSWLRQQEGQ
jgi:cytochrome c oxidase subunit II